MHIKVDQVETNLQRQCTLSNHLDFYHEKWRSMSRSATFQWWHSMANTHVTKHHHCAFLTGSHCFQDVNMSNYVPWKLRTRSPSTTFVMVPFDGEQTGSLSIFALAVTMILGDFLQNFIWHITWTVWPWNEGQVEKKIGPMPFNYHWLNLYWQICFQIYFELSGNKCFGTKVAETHTYKHTGLETSNSYR